MGRRCLGVDVTRCRAAGESERVSRPGTAIGLHAVPGCCDRAGGGIAPAVLPHPGPTVPYHGGSCGASEHTIEVKQRYQTQPTEEPLWQSAANIGQPDVPPAAMPIQGTPPCPLFAHAKAHQVTRVRSGSSPLQPQDLAQMAADPAIQVLRNRHHPNVAVVVQRWRPA